MDIFPAMLPYLTIYDHTKYAHWGPVYLAEMRSLHVVAPELHREFDNQVPCMISNGIIGITRNDTARDCFCITWQNAPMSHTKESLYDVVKRMTKPSSPTNMLCHQEMYMILKQ